jgi:hypothetical protein
MRSCSYDDLQHAITDDRPSGIFRSNLPTPAGPAMAGNHGSVIILLTCRNKKSTYC